MNILIVGGAGFLGSNLVRRCLEEPGNRITVVDALDPRMHSSTESLREVWSDIQFVQGDMGDAILMGDLVRENNIIFNCAAQTSHPLSLQDPLFDAEINCLGNLKLLETIRRHNPAATVIYPSSSTVIGRAVGDIIDETHGEKPLDIYSANKGVAEKYYGIYHVVHQIKTVVLRFANLYGPYGKGRPEFGFVNYFINLAHQGKDITVYGNGEQTRNVMYVADAVDILYRSAFMPQLVGKTLFATHDQHLSIAEIAQNIVTVFERGRVIHVEWPDVRKRIDVDHVFISAARLRRLTNWQPRYSFTEGLIQTRQIMEQVEQPMAV